MEHGFGILTPLLIGCGLNRKSPPMHLQPSFSLQGDLNNDHGQRHVESDMDYGGMAGERKRRFKGTRLWPAFGRQSLVGSLGGYTSHGYTSHASPRACGARLGQIVKSV